MKPIVFDGEHYEELKRRVVDVHRLIGHIRMPVDPSELFEAMGVTVISYQALHACDITRSSAIDWEGRKLFGYCPSGISFTMERDGRDIRYVAVDTEESGGRVRFTKSHEAAHVYLGHREDSRTAEAEADFCARFFLAPPVLVNELDVITPESIATAFGLSQDCASNACRAHRNWLTHRNSNRELDEELLWLRKKGEALERMSASYMSC